MEEKSENLVSYSPRQCERSFIDYFKVEATGRQITETDIMGDTKENEMSWFAFKSGRI